jgi:hypothetical protein
MIYSLHRWKSLLPTLCSFVFRKEGEEEDKARVKRSGKRVPPFGRNALDFCLEVFQTTTWEIHRTQTESKSEEFPEEEELESLSLGSRS